MVYGRVDGIRLVKIEGTKTAVGPAAGAAIGGIAGSTIGNSRTSSNIGAIAGAVASGIAGAAAEEAITRKQGIELTVRTDSGKVIAVVQEVDDNATFAVGDRVRVLTVNGVTRVTR